MQHINTKSVHSMNKDKVQHSIFTFYNIQQLWMLTVIEHKRKQRTKAIQALHKSIQHTRHRAANQRVLETYTMVAFKRTVIHAIETENHDNYGSTINLGTHLLSSSKQGSHTRTSFSMPNFGMVEYLDEHLPQKIWPHARQWCWKSKKTQIEVNSCTCAINIQYTPQNAAVTE